MRKDVELADGKKVQQTRASVKALCEICRRKDQAAGWKALPEICKA